MVAILGCRTPATSRPSSTAASTADAPVSHHEPNSPPEPATETTTPPIVPPSPPPCRDATYGAVEVDCTARRIFVVHRIAFAYDKADILPISHALLDELVLALRDQPGLRLRLAGNLAGPETYPRARRLGEDRAQAVARYLVDQGIARDRLDTLSFEADRPLQPPHRGDIVATELNRRIDIGILDDEGHDGDVQWSATAWCQGFGRTDPVVDCRARTIVGSDLRRVLPRILEAQPRLRVRLHGKHAKLEAALRQAGISKERYTVCEGNDARVEIVAPTEALGCSTMTG